jgi:hypothetical protein
VAVAGVVVSDRVGCHDGGVRELVYLSQSKLQQFAAGQPPRWGSRAEVEADLKVPGVGGIKVRPKDDGGGRASGADLDKVITALESTDRASRWFTDDVQPGQWIQFEAPLSYTTKGTAVIFLDLDRPTAAYPTGGTIRLLLYGSREHLLGDSSRRITGRELAKAAGVSFEPVQHLLRHVAEEAPSGDTVKWRYRPVRLDLLHMIVHVLSDHLELPHTAAWMAGHARVTAVSVASPARIVVATPLYVQYVSAPQVPD